MITTAVLFFVSFAFVNLLGALPRIRGSILFVSTAFTLFAGSGVPTKFLIDRLQTHPRATVVPWARRNVIVVLGGGVVRWPDGRVSSSALVASRVLEARRRWAACVGPDRTCTIVTSGGDVARVGQSEAETMARELVEAGVPRADIVTEEKSLNTLQNARFMTDILQRQPADVVVLVTSGLHLTRALLQFAYPGPRPYAAPSDHWIVRPSWIPTSRNLFLLDLAAHEWLGIVRHQIYRTLDWNG